MTHQHIHNEILKEIYRLYGEQTQHLPVSCRKYCANCCTTSVTMTRIEGLLISGAGLEHPAINPASSRQLDIFPRFQPRLSTNAFVAACRTAVESDEDETGGGMHSGTCPFLVNGACAIYPVRPFGCRCMISTMPCSENGYAEIDDYTLTVNTVFMQFIEHLDHNGFSGNMLDVLIRLSTDNGNVPESCHIIPNHPIPALMVPPAHRSRIEGLIHALDRLIKRV